MTLNSKRVSPKTIEETYTDNDVPKDAMNEYGIRPITAYDQSVGFQFDYPMRWLNDKSDYKAIGIRRLKIVPTQHNINLVVAFDLRWLSMTSHPSDEDNKTDFICDYCWTDDGTCVVPLKILPTNSMDEIMNSIINTVNQHLHTKQPYNYVRSVFRVPDADVGDGNYEDFAQEKYIILEDSDMKKTVDVVPSYINFDYEYDSINGNLDIAFTTQVFMDTDLGFLFSPVILDRDIKAVTKSTENSFMSQNMAKAGFAFDTSKNNPTVEPLIQLLKFFNQEVNEQTINYLVQSKLMMSFKNVWDREVLQVHASFSDNNRNFIGLNGDFYEKPSVLYEPPTNSSNFGVWFTTDGHRRLLLRYCRFFIGLCFIRNYNTSLATK